MMRRNSRNLARILLCFIFGLVSTRLFLSIIFIDLSLDIIRGPFAGLPKKEQLPIIAYLLISPLQIPCLTRSLLTVFINFNYQFGHPVVVFYRDSIDLWEIHKRMKDDLDNFMLSIIEFQQINPDVLSESNTIEWSAKFWLKEVYLQPRLKNYNVTYILRLEPNFILQRKIHFDIFHYMNDQRIKYAFKPDPYVDISPTVPILRQLPFIYLISRSHDLLPFRTKSMNWVTNLNKLEVEVDDIGALTTDLSYEILHVDSCSDEFHFLKSIENYKYDHILECYIWN